MQRITDDVELTQVQVVHAEGDRAAMLLHGRDAEVSSAFIRKWSFISSHKKLKFHFPSVAVTAPLHSAVTTPRHATITVRVLSGLQTTRMTVGLSGSQVLTRIGGTIGPAPCPETRTAITVTVPQWVCRPAMAGSQAESDDPPRKPATARRAKCNSTTS